MTRRRRFLRRLFPLLLILLVGGILAYLLLRDLPRRWLQNTLSQSLEAKVTVGALEIHWPRDVFLREVELRDVRSVPQAAEVRIAEIHVEGHWRELLKRRAEVVTLRGLEGELQPPTRPATPFPIREQPFTVNRFEVLPARLQVGDGPALHLKGYLQGLGGPIADLVGTLDFNAPRLPVAPLLALLPANLDSENSPDPSIRDLVGDLVGLRGKLERTPPEWHLSAVFQSARLQRGQHEVELDSSGFEARLEPDPQQPPGKGYRLSVDPRLPEVESAYLIATLDPEGQPRGVEAFLRGVDLTTWLPLVLTLPPGWEVEGTAEARLSSAAVDPTVKPIRYHLAAHLTRLTAPAGSLPTLGPAGTLPQTLRGLRLEAEGEADLGSRAAAAASLRAALSMPAEGNVGVPAPLLPLRLTADGDFTAALSGDAAFAPAFQGRFEARIGALGRGHAEGRANLQTAGLSWRWDAGSLEDLLPHLETLRPDLAETLTDWQVRGEADASGTFRGPWRRGRLEASLTVDTAALEGPALHLTAPRLEGRLRGTLAQASRKPWSWQLLEAPVTLTGGVLESRTVTAGARGQLRPVHPPQEGAQEGAAQEGATHFAGIFLERADLDAGELGTARLSGPTNPTAGRELTLDLQAPGIEPWLEALQPLLGGSIAEATQGYTLQGATHVVLRLRPDPADSDRLDAWGGEGTVEFTDGGFLSEDGSRVAQGLTARGELRWQPEEAWVALRFGGFQLLWNTFYADYEDTRAQLVTALRRSTPKAGEPSWQADLDLRLPEGPVASARLEPARSSETDGAEILRYRLTLAVDNLGNTLERYVQQPFQGSVLGVDALRLGGVARLEVAGEVGRNAGSARGRLELRALEVAGQKAPVAVRGLEMDLPLDVGWRRNDGEPLEIEGPARPGFLRFQEFTAAGLTLPPTATDLTVKGDTVALEQGVTVPLLSGELHLARLSLARLLRPDRNLATALSLEGVQLEEASRAFALPRLQGELSGDLPNVRITEDRLRVEGGGTLDVFGGTVAVHDISGRDLFSRFPRITFSADLEGIHLLELTQTFELGNLSGILEGTLQDCQLFQGVPVRCRGRLYSVRTPGVKQYIDVQAINNIAIVGTGNRVTVFDRGIHRFFRRYRYRALGAEIQLVNDQFLLRGLEQRGQRELFLKGRLPLRIDVVNAQPGRTVSFRTMLERLQNVSYSKGTPEEP